MTSAACPRGWRATSAWAVDSYKRGPIRAPQSLARDRRPRRTLSSTLSIVLQPGRAHCRLPKRERFNYFEAIDAVAADQALWTITAERSLLVIDTTRYPAYVDVRVKVPQGGVLRILAPRDRAFATQGHIFVLWMAGATLILTAIAVLFIRNQVRAIERLAAAAEAFGKRRRHRLQAPRRARGAPGRPGLPGHEGAAAAPHRPAHRSCWPPSATTFAHPLTRLKLELPPWPSPRRAWTPSSSDLAEMEHMIDEYLAFARGQGGEALEDRRSSAALIRDVG